MTGAQICSSHAPLKLMAASSDLSKQIVLTCTEYMGRQKQLTCMLVIFMIVPSTLGWKTDIKSVAIGKSFPLPLLNVRRSQTHMSARFLSSYFPVNTVYHIHVTENDTENCCLDLVQYNYDYSM